MVGSGRRLPGAARGRFGVPGVALAVGILLGGAPLAAILLQPLAGSSAGRSPPCSWRGGRAGPREPRTRSGAHRPDRRRPGHRLSVGGGARGRDGFGAGATADRWVRSILPGGYAIRLTVADDIDSVRRPGDHPRRRSGHAHQRVPRGDRDRGRSSARWASPASTPATSRTRARSSSPRRPATMPSTRWRRRRRARSRVDRRPRRPGCRRHRQLSGSPAATGSRSPSPGSWPTRCRPGRPRARS